MAVRSGGRALRAKRRSHPERRAANGWKNPDPVKAVQQDRNKKDNAASKGHKFQRVRQKKTPALVIIRRVMFFIRVGQGRRVVAENGKL